MPNTQNIQKTSPSSPAAYAGAAIPQTPLHAPDNRITESQGVLENEEDPRIPDDAPTALHNLPVEAMVRSADERPGATDRPRARELSAAELSSNRPTGGKE